jgi:hypothetical protein
MSISFISRIAAVSWVVLFAIGGSFSPVAAKPPGPSVLGEVTITEGERSGYFTEVILPLGGGQDIHYGVYARGYGDIGDSPAGDAGGFVHFSKIPIKQCGITSFFGMTQDSKATGKVRGFCRL